MTKRNTIQRSLVLDTVRKLKNHATADEIYNEISKEHPNISKGTVYRNLQRLCDIGEIRKREVPGGPDHYDHLCGDHYHIKCIKCSRVFDVDMDYISDLEDAVRDTKGFIFLEHDVVFQGICPECRAALHNAGLDSERPAEK